MFEMKLFLSLDQMLLNPTPKWRDGRRTKYFMNYV